MFSTTTISPGGSPVDIARVPGRASRRDARASRAAQWRLGSAAVALALAAWTVPSTLQAATFSVNSTADVVDAAPGDGVCDSAPPAGVCTLRAAVIEANALAGADDIDLPAGVYTLSLAGSDQVAFVGDLDITEDLTVSGAGVASTIVDAAGIDRVFDVFGGVTASLSDLTLRNGVVVGADGGAIQSIGTLTLTDVALSASSSRIGGALFSKAGTATLVRVVATGNSAQDGGAVALKDGTMSVIDSTLAGNAASRQGGGLHNDSGAITVSGTTISGNSAGMEDGGGLISRGGGATADLVNVTVSGNSSGRKGGGIHQEGASMSAVNVTLTGNGSPDGGGVRLQTGAFQLTNTIVANSTAGGDCTGLALDTTPGGNLDSDGSCSAQLTADPLLGPLADNGGPTATHALLAGSPALDNGVNTGCPGTDQRGYARPFNVTCDIGAYEESNYDIVIDNDFSDWDNGVGNEFCVDDEGGAEDWSNPTTADITKFCIAGNQSDTVYLLFGFDVDGIDEPLSPGNSSTACVLVDTNVDEKIEYVVCTTLIGPGSQVGAVELYSCDNSLIDGCGGAALDKTYTVADYGFSDTAAGPFGGRDSFLELALPYTDLGISGGTIYFSSLVSYPGKTFLTAPKDSIFGDGGQDYDSRIAYDLDSGSGASTTPVTLSYFSASGRGGWVELTWQTVTETANLGFHLYVLEGDGWRRLNRELIPSKVVDSLEPQEYVYEATGVEGTLFLIEDVDIHGKSRHHGPFELDRAGGHRSAGEKPIAWGRISREHAVKKAARAGREMARSALRRRRRGYPQARLLVERQGIHRLSYEDLVAAGVDLSGVPVRFLALTSGGKPVPLRVGGRGRFGPGSFLEFLGEPLDTLYTRTNVYSLVVNPRLARRIPTDRTPARPWARTPAFYMESARVERNRAYYPIAPGDDPWYDTRLLATGGPVEAELDLELEGRVETAGGVQLEVALWGMSDLPGAPDHHVVVEVNGVELADAFFEGRVEHRLTVEVPRSVLEPEGNRMRLILPHDTGASYDLVGYDSYRVDYPRRFAARDGRLHFTAAAGAFRVDGLPSSQVVVHRAGSGTVERLAQVQVTGTPGAYSAVFAGTGSEATYYVSTVGALETPAIELARPRRNLVRGEAELLIITHPDFLGAVQPLVHTRRADGFSVRVVDTEAIYTSFSHGVFDPQAIRAFIRRAFAEMGTDYVLLVGGDTYDYHDNLGQGAISFVPTLYAQTDALLRYVPTDSLYADVDRDGVVDLAIGRLPVRTVAELETVIDKTLEYGSIGYRGTAVLAADAYDVAAGHSFTADSNALLALLPPDWQVRRAYLDELGLAEARERLIQNINDGVALTSYFGHSGLTLWSFQGLFTSADADLLENRGRPTVVTQWGCWNTYFVSPSYKSMGHRLLLNPDGGAAAVLGAAALTDANAERELARRLFQRLTAPGQTLGRAVLEAKRDLALTRPDQLDVLLGLTLLGDPTLTVLP